MAAVVQADGKYLNRSQGSEEFNDFGFFAGGLKTVEQIAFQLEGRAVRLQFRMGDPALGIKMTDDFH